MNDDHNMFEKCDKPEQLWLVQKYDNGDFFLYHWTPILAKKGYTVLKESDAKSLLDLVRKKKNNVRYLEEDTFKTTNDTIKLIKVVPDEETEIEEGEDENTAKLVASVSADAKDVDRPLDEVRDIEVTQEDIMSKEIKVIASFKHKSTLENHLLSKYQLEIPMDRLSVMKAIANKMITDLAKQNRLYLVDGLIDAK